MYDKSINEITFPKSASNSKQSAIDFWCLTNNLDAYKAYRSDGNSDKINPCLRKEKPLDSANYKTVKELDNIFSSMPKEYCPAEDETVYRGINLNKDLKNLKDIITKQNNPNTCYFNDKAIISTSKDYDVAKDFSYSEDSVMLKITIPKGSKRLDPEKLPSFYRKKLSDVEREVLLPRNSRFRVDSYDPETKIAEVTYMGQDFPLPKICEKFEEDNPFEDGLETLGKVLKAQLNLKDKY